MNKISVREFQLHANKYLKQLPIVLTQYGKEVATVENVLTDKKGTIKSSNIPKKITKENINKILGKIEYCQHFVNKLTCERCNE